MQLGVNAGCFQHHLLILGTLIWECPNLILIKNKSNQ